MSTEVSDIMVRDIKTATPEETVLEIIKTMNRYEIGSIVVTENGKPVGIVTERDVLKRLVSKEKNPAETRLYEIMSHPLVTVEPHTTAMSAARLMIKQKIKKLIITNSGELLGVLSLTDLIPLLRKHGTIEKLPLKNASKHVKRVFDIYFDAERKIRKKCPVIVLGGMLINCMGPKCMWYSPNGCAGSKS